MKNEKHDCLEMFSVWILDMEGQRRRRGNPRQQSSRIKLNSTSNVCNWNGNKSPSLQPTVHPKQRNKQTLFRIYHLRWRDVSLGLETWSAVEEKSDHRPPSCKCGFKCNQVIVVYVNLSSWSPALNMRFFSKQKWRAAKYEEKTKEAAVLNLRSLSITTKVSTTETVVGWIGWTKPEETQRISKTESQTEFSQSLYEQNRVSAVFLWKWNLRSENKE